MSDLFDNFRDLLKIAAWVWCVYNMCMHECKITNLAAAAVVEWRGRERGGGAAGQLFLAPERDSAPLPPLEPFTRSETRYVYTLCRRLQ